MTTLSPRTLWSIPRVGAPHATGDGRLLVPVTTHDDGPPHTVLWRIDPATGSQSPFASGQISGFAVSTDAGAVAYLRKNGEHRQVYRQPLDGGEGVQVADLPLGAVGVKWMPTGDLLAMAVLDRDHPTVEGTAGAERDSEVSARVTEDAVYRYWDMWLEHVYHPVLINQEGEVTDLTPGATRFWSWPNTNDIAGDVDVSPDGELIAFAADDSAPPHRELSWSLFLMQRDGSELRRIDLDMNGHCHRPRFSPDGRTIIFGYQAVPEFYACRVQLMRYDIADDSISEILPDWSLTPQGWEFDTKGRLVFIAEDKGRQRLYRLNGADEVDPLTEHGWVSSPTFSADGATHVLSQSLSSPPEIAVISESDAGSTASVEIVTDFTSAALAEIQLGRVREITVNGGEGRPVQVWIVDPPDSDPDSPLPLVHMIHGGPHGVFGDTWHWRWNAQVVAASGYRVAHVNFHGSTGWGEDFTASILGNWGDLPYKDVEATTDQLISAGLADPDRIAVTGGSYGGYLTAWITSQTGRYTCAIAHAAVTNLGGMYASDVTYGRELSYGAEVWDDPERINRWSPSAHAAGYSTPTLVIHGAKDERVPFTQGLELYGVLVAKGVPARLVTYPDENHWILSKANSIHWYDEFLGWLSRWMDANENGS